MTTTQVLPHWDMSTIFPSLSSSEFQKAFADLLQGIEDLEQFCNTHAIDALPEPRPLDDEQIATFGSLIHQFNDILARANTIHAYIICFVRTDSQDAQAQARLSEMQQPIVRLSILDTRFSAWIGSIPVQELLERSSLAREYEFFLHHTSERATHLMSSAEETLAAELNVSGGHAWSRLHGDLTSQIMVPIELDGEQQVLPMSRIRALAHHSDRQVRERAYQAELRGWQTVDRPLAAALNSIKHEVNVLSKRRNWSSALEETLLSNSIDQQILDAMMSAAHKSFPAFRRYLRAKAKALGVSQLAWYDLMAPLQEASDAWSWEQAKAFVVEQFGTYSEKMASYAARAFREQWLDAEPRQGKRDGAFCISLREDESRVFLNYEPNFDLVSTLAHELGHGYHNLNLASRAPLQKTHPMTLAETASIFCETIVQQAALARVSPTEQVAILETSLLGSCQVVVDITSRFLFEQRVFEQRQKRELSVAELNELMLEAQRETYGDGLDQSTLHPYMWAVKQHYYTTGRSYYNYPYMFGLLFGLGLYVHYQKDPESFKRGYDDLLSSTGLADAATLAQRFGIDLRSEAFWAASLAQIEANITRFEQLVDEQTSAK